ncbi:uncharacterized protein B0H64DRAFT_411084 [Chaetomium fimeti]|uniref:Uncharacterized protein n=1 Tax=Chaetomium fimeti TaxID=1854472 RepID=A0AAE0H700_9PEZI|nr:hypothetical protein B0H64DRAFT_411084 [Chaetomium fimeti]
MHFSSGFLVALLAAVTIGSPVGDDAQTIEKRSCLTDCMSNCSAPRGASCSNACMTSCSYDYSGGKRYSRINLDDFVHNWNGRLGCHSHTGS